MQGRYGTDQIPGLSSSLQNEGPEEKDPVKRWNMADVCNLLASWIYALKTIPACKKIRKRKGNRFHRISCSLGSSSIVLMFSYPCVQIGL